MASALSKEMQGRVATSLAGYLRSDPLQYLSGGAAVQASSSARVGSIHRPTWDLDLITQAPGATKTTTFDINIPHKIFTVDVTCASSICPQFSPLVMEANEMNLLFMLGDRSRLKLMFEGRIRYEALETVLANKAHTMATRFPQRRGELGKDLFDVGLLASYTDPCVLDQSKASTNFTREMFYLSASFVSFYPKSMAKRTASDFAQGSIEKLSRAAREKFKVEECKIMSFIEQTPSLLPVMLLAAANEQLRDRMPFIMRIPEACKDFSNATNSAIARALVSGDTRTLDATVQSVIKKARQLRQMT